MAVRTGFDASLDDVEMDLLCTYAGVPAPFPLRVRSVGATGTERRQLFAAARDRLAARGLADHRGPLGVAETLVYLLRSCRTTVDLVLAIRSERLGAVLLRHHHTAVLAVAELSSPGRPVGMVGLSPDEGVAELLRLIPDLNAAMTTPFTVPRRALTEVYRVLLSRSGPMRTHELDELLATHGIDERLAHRLVTQLQPALGSGQAGLARRGGYAGDWRRTGEELCWLDTENGRFRMARTGDWTSVNPLFTNELYSSIRRLAASAEE